MSPTEPISQGFVLELMRQLTERVDGGHARVREGLNELKCDLKELATLVTTDRITLSELHTRQKATEQALSACPIARHLVVSGQLQHIAASTDARFVWMERVMMYILGLIAILATGALGYFGVLVKQAIEHAMGGG